MSRLGELLVAARLLDPEQVERALRAQVLWGGRLGTNLIELGYLDLDGISRALGRQHGVPAALARHFDKANRELQERLDAALAMKWSVVPLVHVGPQKKLAIAVLDPLPAEALAELADAFLCEPASIVVSIAAEMRVRYHLERVYGIRRTARFLRSRGKTIPPFPIFDPNAMPFDIEEPTSPTIVPETPAPPPSLPAHADEIAAMIDAAIDAATTPAPETGGRERRSYVRLIVDEPKVEEPLKVGDTQPLGRIPIRKVAKTAAPPCPRPATRTPQSLADATRAIRRAADRDRAADLIIDALVRFAPVCDAGMLLVIRGEVAIGWKYFCRDGANPPELAVPLDQPGLCVSAVERDCTARAPAGSLGEIDLLLLRALGKLDGDLAVVPIPIAGKVMCLLAVVAAEGREIAAVEAIAAAAGAAFARLIRDASR
jgi:hypothetical protein